MQQYKMCVYIGRIQTNTQQPRTKLNWTNQANRCKCTHFAGLICKQEIFATNWRLKTQHYCRRHYWICTVFDVVYFEFGARKMVKIDDSQSADSQQLRSFHRIDCTRSNPLPRNRLYSIFVWRFFFLLALVPFGSLFYFVWVCVCVCVRVFEVEVNIFVGTSEWMKKKKR